MNMIDLWSELPPFLRAGLGVLLIGVALLIWFATEGRLYAIGLGALGLVFLLFCNIGNDSGGYHF
jgi:hypothetical protein